MLSHSLQYLDADSNTDWHPHRNEHADAHQDSHPETDEDADSHSHLHTHLDADDNTCGDGSGAGRNVSNGLRPCA